MAIGRSTFKRVKVKIDKVADVSDALSRLAETRVMAGIPSSKTSRNDDQPINNAQLMAIHESGAPEVNLPARPVVHPAIKASQAEITKGLEEAGKAALAGNVSGTDKAFQAVGIIAQNAMRKRITDGPFAPLSPRTIAARAAKAGRARRKGEQKYLDLVNSGISPAEAQTAAGIKPLIDTGQLRRALTYVIRKVTWKGKIIAKQLKDASKLRK
jgi:hypothetical protein